jgi:hypothetical protein
VLGLSLPEPEPEPEPPEPVSPVPVSPVPFQVWSTPSTTGPIGRGAAGGEVMGLAGMPVLVEPPGCGLLPVLGAGVAPLPGAPIDVVPPVPVVVSRSTEPTVELGPRAPVGVTGAVRVAADGDEGPVGFRPAPGPGAVAV